MLLAAITSGLLVGALGGSRLKRVSLSRLTIVGFGLAGFTWLAAVYAQWLPATVALFCFAAIPVDVTNAVSAALEQTYVPEELLGRVTSLTFSASAAAMPVGSLLGGVAGDAVGSAVVVALTGGGFLFVTLYWLAHPLLRYVPPVEEIDPAEYGLGQV